MKKNWFLGTVGFFFGAIIVGIYFASQEATWRRQQQALQDEIHRLRLELQNAPSPAHEVAPEVIEKQQFVAVDRQEDPRDIVARLQQIRIAPGQNQTRNTRIAVQQFENLIATGTNALPAIRDFLLRNEEVDYESWISPRGSRDGRIATEFTVPPSLRFGLFDATRTIGGQGAEELFAEILATTGRGAEVAYLTRVLQEIAPNKYRDAAIMAARELLSQPLNGTTNGIDRYDREYLYGVLTLFGDTSYAPEAQAKLARADGTIDRGALRYLQQTMGEQALPFIGEMYRNPNVQPEQKEYLGRFALNYAGANPLADEIWRNSIFDRNISANDREDLIEDLNEDGFQNRREPSERDLIVARNRLALINRHRQNSDDAVIQRAFAEAERDLKRMLDRATQQAQNQ